MSAAESPPQNNLYSAKGPPASVDVPFEYREGRVWTRVHIQGEAVWAIFDTGADGTALDSQVAEHIGLRGKGEERGSTVAGEIELVRAGPAEIAIGPRKLPAEDVMLVPLAAQMPGLQAIVGFDVLREMPFTLDYGKRRILLDVLPAGPSFPFVLDSDIRPTTRLETLGGRFEAHLDTGSSRGVSLPLDWVRANAPNVLRGETRREILGDAVSAMPFTLDKVSLGGVELEGVPGEGVSSEAGSFAAQQTRWANVGNEVLGRFRLGIDGRERRSIFELVR